MTEAKTCNGCNHSIVLMDEMWCRRKMTVDKIYGPIVHYMPCWLERSRIKGLLGACGHAGRFFEPLTSKHHPSESMRVRK